MRWLLALCLLGTTSPALAASGEEASAEVGSADSGGSPVLFVSGAYLLVLGSAGLVTGLLFTTAGPVEYCPNCISGQSEVLGTTLLLTGFAAATAGAALVIVGSNSADDEEPADTARLMPSIALSPSGGAMAWRF